ncbi:RNA degradosome polyphosphate kinase [Marinicrinis sediminis]|uniref:Polyphosphate kinase n=1 Tax=Marinicrinis sediminis TaxID=1652465 RepID=A0ABW5RA44_9BACL
MHKETSTGTGLNQQPQVSTAEKGLESGTYKYINRDLSWMEFNRRVMEEAEDNTTPLLERVKFLSIVSSNLDEFMSVRVAGIIDQIKAGYTKKDFTGYTPFQLYKRVMRRSVKMVSDQYKIYRDLLRQLAKEHIHITQYTDLSINQKKSVDQYFEDIVFPVLTPMAVDQSRPFPLVHSLGLYMAVLLKKDRPRKTDEQEEPFFAIIQVPSILPRYYEIPGRANSKKKEYILLEEIIRHRIHTMFEGYTPISIGGFRMTRNADLTLNEEGAEDLLEEIEKELRKRRWGVPVRLEIEKGMDPLALEMLQEEFEIEEDIFEIDGPLDLTFLMKLSLGMTGKDHLRYEKLVGEYPREFHDCEDMFEVIRNQDVLLYHPYESFDALIDFAEQAAEDPQVLAIKMTLYRVSGNSPLIKALEQAAEAGKQVTVVVELKARFDEENNIQWARQLEKAGCHVVYGLVGLKTHAKIMLVVRREEDQLRRYVHVGTGNYNEKTAKLYTDLGLFTTNSEIGEDASALFNEITGYSSLHEWKALSVAPTDMKPLLIDYIRKEAQHAREGKPAHIIVKMNSLSHQPMIDELYRASQAGVKIDLIIRGICCLCPGVKGLSEHINVISIVDRFLEHTRMFYFENNGDSTVFISSADWMTRNLVRRVELMSPVLDPSLKKSVIGILNLCLSDNVKARRLLMSGKYERVVEANKKPLRSQFEAEKIKKWKL